MLFYNGKNVPIYPNTMATKLDRTSFLWSKARAWTVGWSIRRHNRNNISLETVGKGQIGNYFQHRILFVPTDMGGINNKPDCKSISTFCIFLLNLFDAKIQCFNLCLRLKLFRITFITSWFRTQLTHYSYSDINTRCHLNCSIVSTVEKRVCY